MTDTRKWSAGAALLIVAVFVASWFLVIAPKRGEASDLEAQTTTQDQANSMLEQKIRQLQVQQQDLPKQEARLATLHQQIPDNPALPSLIRGLSAAGRQVGVTLDSLAPSAPVQAVAAVAAPVTSTPATGTTGSTGTTTTVAPAASAATLWQIPLNITVTGSYFELEQFLNKLEGQHRSLLVTGFQIAPAATEEAAPDDLAVTLNTRVFLSQAAAPAAATTPVAPATTN